MLIFQFLNDKIHNYVLFDIIVNSIIQKLKNKHTFLKKPQKIAKLSKAKFSHFEGTRGDKNQIFRTLDATEREVRYSIWSWELQKIKILQMM